MPAPNSGRRLLAVGFTAAVVGVAAFVAPRPAAVTADEPKPKVETAKAEDATPKTETPKAETPKTDDTKPKVEPAKPKVEPVKADEPKPKVEPAKPDAPKAPAPGDPPSKKASGEPLPMFGGSVERNMVNMAAKGITDNPDPAGDALTWKAQLGSRAYGGPTIADGRIFVGTNNDNPRNKRDVAKVGGEDEPIDKGVLMCFNTKGEFQWQAIHKKLESGQVNDWPREGVCSTPTVEGDRVYYITNRCTVVCASVKGLAADKDTKPLIYTDEKTKKPVTFDSPTDAGIVWEYDMMKSLGVFPHNMSAGCPLIVGDLLYTVTGNGVDEGHINIPAPEAASFICLNKKTGKLVWKENLPGKNIMHGQWSNPSLMTVDGKPQIVIPGGDGWIYAFAPDTGEVLWKFDANPKTAIYELGGAGTQSDFIATPVIHDNKIYIGTGQDPEHFTGIAHFYCIDPAGKKGDISPEVGPRAKPGEADPKAGKPNPNSGVVWSYGGADARKFALREFKFGRTMSTACIVDGICYISELAGIVHALDAKTGKVLWTYETKSQIWGSCYYADGKIYLACENGELFVFKHVPLAQKPKELDIFDNPDAQDQKSYSKQYKLKRKAVEDEYLLKKVTFDAAIRSTPVVADNVLYVMTENALYAFGKKK